MVKCLKCGEGIAIFLEGLFRPTFMNVICPACNTKLELINASACYFPNGIISSVPLVLFYFYELPFLWIWVILAGFLCWLLNPVIVMFFGRWHIWAYDIEEQSKLELLAVIHTISTITAGIWVLYMAKTLLFPYFTFIEEFDIDSEQFTQLSDHYKKTFSEQGIIGLAIGIVSITLSGSTTIIKGNVRRRSIEKALHKLN